jgi:hypothetical protein
MLAAHGDDRSGLFTYFTYLTWRIIMDERERLLKRAEELEHEVAALKKRLDELHEFPRAGEPWSVEEDNILLRGFNNGYSLSELMKAHGRRPGAITSRLVRHRRLVLLPGSGKNAYFRVYETPWCECPYEKRYADLGDRGRGRVRD